MTCGAALGQDGGGGDDWILASRDSANTCYSPLAEITAANVKDLRLAFSFSMGVGRGQEAAPIVSDGTMFLVGPYPNILYALELSKPGAPLKWRFEPRPDASAQGVACCDVVNRGAAYADGRVFFNTLDNHTLAVDAETGRELWRVKLGDIGRGETMTMVPLA